MAEVEAAYEAIMMRQLAQRMKGQITGGLKVSKDLAYADKWVSSTWRMTWLRAVRIAGP